MKILKMKMLKQAKMNIDCYVLDVFKLSFLYI